MRLHIKPENDRLVELYTNHGHYHNGDSGYDLYCPETVTIPPGLGHVVDMKVKCEAFLDSSDENNARVNTSYYLYPRSSIYKTPLRLANSVGIIDGGYRGSVKAVFDNLGSEDFQIIEGTRLVQLCGPNLEPITCYITDVLSNTERGDGGFGSTDN